jgi:hypothetical protein
MTLDQLQIFIAVAEREHVTRAADALGLAPPSVSAAVASLEREFGTKLFHRVGRGIVVTEGGKVLLDEVRTLVNRAEVVKLAMRVHGSCPWTSPNQRQSDDSEPFPVTQTGRLSPSPPSSCHPTRRFSPLSSPVPAPPFCPRASAPTL